MVLEILTKIGINEMTKTLINNCLQIVSSSKRLVYLKWFTDGQLTETDFEHASRANPMLFRSKTKSPQWDVFAEMFAEKGLAAACRRSKTVKQRVLAVAGRWCPKWVKRVVRRVLWR